MAHRFAAPTAVTTFGGTRMLNGEENPAVFGAMFYLKSNDAASYRLIRICTDTKINMGVKS